MQKASHILKKESGLYMLDASTSLDDVAKVAEQKGFSLYHIDGSLVEDSDDFLEQARKVFPQLVGDDWDGLISALKDCSWCKSSGVIVLFSDFQNFAHQNRVHFNAAMDSLRDAAIFWHNHMSQMQPVFILLKGHTTAMPGPYVNAR
jgi:hypothetical protein